jgi:hypothetical protein
MDDKEKVPILLAEYKTLRDEVISARATIERTVRMIVGSVLVAIGLSVAPGGPGPKLGFWVPVAVAVLYFTTVVVWNEINTRRFTARLRVLENDINRRAGERLLIWETDSGWGSAVLPLNPGSKSMGT